MLTANEVREQVSILDTIKKYGVTPEKTGREYRAHCPFHSDKDPSMTIDENKGYFFCHGACNSGGDVIEFVEKIEGCTFKQALEKLSSGLVTTKVISKGEKKEIIEKIVWTPVPIDDIPKDADKRLPKKCYEKKISEYYPWYNKDSNLIGYTIRVPKVNGKDVFPLTFCSSGKKTSWQYRGFGHHIYGIHLVYRHPEATIFVVEGEKNRDDLQRIVGFEGKFVVISSGNLKKVKHIDWSPLIGRKMVLWPDADSHIYEKGLRKGQVMEMTEQPGVAVMLYISKLIDGEFWMVIPAKDKVNGWDVSDAIRKEKWDRKKIFDYMRSQTVKVNEYFKTADKKVANENTAPFRCIGFTASRGSIHYNYLPDGTNTVTSYPPSMHSKANLLSLAPIDYWETTYPQKKGFNLQDATNDLFRECEAIGPFDPLSIRGRGAWYDRGRIVLHLGNVLLVNNKEYKPYDIDSDYIYESGKPLRYEFSREPLDRDNASILFEICKLMTWQQRLSARLLAGWLFLAPVCGALDWRPHIWLTSEPGTGKSWIMDHIVSKLLGGFCVDIVGDPSEAAVRAMLGSDGVPVRYDESESQNKALYNKLESVIKLARIASSNKKSVIPRSTVDGRAIFWVVRSMFLLSSVVAKLDKQTDKDRFSILKLQKSADFANSENFKKIKYMVSKHITDKFAARLKTRAVHCIPNIRKNIEIFVEEVTEKLNNRRQGDQIGTLLAGCYSLMYDGVITPELAQKYVDGVDFYSETNVSYETDQSNLIDLIFEHMVRDDAKNNISIGELSRMAVFEFKNCPTIEESNMRRDEARKAKVLLNRYGITTIKSRRYEFCSDVAFVENHSYLCKILDGTSWSIGYSTVLERVPGASICRIRFNGKRRRCVVIPAIQLFPDMSEDVEENYDIGF